MKKLMIIAALFTASVAANAQQLSNGVYEKKKVVTSESMTADKFYIRALEKLSDWSGSLGRSKAHIDIQDKDEHLIVYKGQYYIGYGKINFMVGWDTSCDFTLKIRCKDGRAQVSAMSSSMTFVLSTDNTTVTIPLAELMPEFTYKGTMNVKKAANLLAPTVPGIIDKIVEDIGSAIVTETTDDDF